MGESQLKKLKATLRSNGLTGPRPKKKQSKQQTAKSREDRAKAVQNIREAFNPFDTKVNRRKQEVHGRTLQGSVGRPGLAKQQDEDARRTQYFAEKKQKDKVGGINDRRFGENDSSMTTEEKMMARFMKERQSKSKSNMFNLDDDDDGDLMYGQSLALQDDYEDDDMFGQDDQDEQANRKRSRTLDEYEQYNEENVDGEGAPAAKKSKNEVMKEVIAKSKLHKHERQQAKEEYLNEVEELDDPSQMQDLYKEMASGSKPAKPAATAAGTGAVKTAINGASGDDYKDYDKTLRELNFDRRAVPADRTKTEEELAKEKEEKRKKLEAKRLARMRGEDVSDSSESEGEPDEPEEVPEDASAAHAFGLDFGSKVAEKGDEEEDEEDEDDEDDDEDDFGDIIDDTIPASSGEEEEDEDEETDIRPKLSNGKADKTGTQTTSCPENVDQLLSVLDGQDLENQVKTIKKIVAAHHPSKAKGNKEKQAVFATVILEYIAYQVEAGNRLGSTVNELLDLVKSIIQSKGHALDTYFITYFRDRLSKIEEKVTGRIEHKHSKSLSPSDLLIFGMIPFFYSASDHYNLVCSPACLIIGQQLSQVPLKSVNCVFVGVYLCSALLAYQQLAARYMPEVPLFIGQALYVLLGNKKDRNSSRDLFLTADAGKNLSIDKKSLSRHEMSGLYLHDLVEAKDANKAKNDIALRLVTTIGQFSKLWTDKSAYAEVFGPLLKQLEPHVSLHPVIKETVDKLQRGIKFATNERLPLSLQSHRPVPLASHAPKFEDNYNLDVKSYDDDTTRQEIKKLQKEMKNEKKSALKELRKDSQFQAREQIQEKRAFYKKYHRDMSRLFDQIQTEEGTEKNKYEREKAARKRNNK